MALLEHRSADGIHYDWLLAPRATVGDEERVVWCARTAARLDLGEFPAMLEPIGLHRGRYLRLPGAVDLGERGVVRPVASGAWCAGAGCEAGRGSAAVGLSVRWGVHAEQMLRLVPKGGTILLDLDGRVRPSPAGPAAGG